VGIEFTPERFAPWHYLVKELARRCGMGDCATLLLDALACKLDY
jgi:hypothetical protein